MKVDMRKSFGPKWDILPGAVPALMLGTLMAATLIFTGCQKTGSDVQGGDSAGSTLRVGYFGATGKGIGLVGWAHKRNLLLPELRAAGVTDIKFIRFVSGPDVNEAMASGSLDFCQFGDSPAITGRAAGISNRVLAISAGASNFWLVTGPNGPKTVEGLRGKTIASMGGGTSLRYARGLLAEKKLTGSVRIVRLDQPLAAAALLRGDIAAAVTNGQLLLNGKLHIIDTATDHNGLLPVGVDVISQQYLDKHPGFAAAWLKMRSRAIDDMHANRDKYYEYAAATWDEPAWFQKKYFPLTFKDTEPFTQKKIEALKATKKFLLQQKMISKDFSIDEWLYKPKFRQAANPGEYSLPGARRYRRSIVAG